MRFLVLTLLSLSSILQAAPLTELWTVEGIVENPESAHVDPITGNIFVSSVAGEPDKADGRGWISLIDSNGKVLDAQWYKGLNAPKGLRTHAGMLWVADINTIYGIEIATKTQRIKTTIPGAKFLNDVAVADDGTVFVSDTLNSKIYELKNGRVTTFKDGKDIESPNGLLVRGDKLIVAAWGKTTDFKNKTSGRLFSLDLKTKKKTAITTKPLGNLDGLEMATTGNFIVSDWAAGKVFTVTPQGLSTEIITGLGGAADLGLVPSTQVIIVPRMMENKVTAYQLPKVG